MNRRQIRLQVYSKWSNFRTWKFWVLSKQLWFFFASNIKYIPNLIAVKANFSKEMILDSANTLQSHHWWWLIDQINYDSHERQTRSSIQHGDIADIRLMICSEYIRVDYSHSRHKLFSFVRYHMILSILNDYGDLMPERNFSRIRHTIIPRLEW